MLSPSEIFARGKRHDAETANHSTNRATPPGYATRNEAIIELIRFGFGIWTQAHMAVLLFHAERSTWYGKDTDQHSQGQAVAGIYSKRAGKWIRGPAGVSGSTSLRINKQLAASGIISRTRRTHANTGHAPTEYSIDWLSVRETIDKFKSHIPTAAEMPLLQGEPDPPCVMVTHTAKSDLTALDITASSSSPAGSATQIREMLDAILGTQLLPAHPAPNQILEVAQALNLADELAIEHVILRFLAEKAREKRASSYHIDGPQLFVTMAREDLIPWLKQNPRAFQAYELAKAQREFDRQRGADLFEMPPPREAPQIQEAGQCPTCNGPLQADGRCYATACLLRTAAAGGQ